MLYNWSLELSPCAGRQRRAKHKPRSLGAGNLHMGPIPAKNPRTAPWWTDHVRARGNLTRLLVFTFYSVFDCPPCTRVISWPTHHDQTHSSHYLHQCAATPTSVMRSIAATSNILWWLQYPALPIWCFNLMCGQRCARDGKTHGKACFPVLLSRMGGRDGNAEIARRESTGNQTKPQIFPYFIVRRK
jgi:hypothetical protein